MVTQRDLEVLSEKITAAIKAGRMIDADQLRTRLGFAFDEYAKQTTIPYRKLVAGQRFAWNDITDSKIYARVRGGYKEAHVDGIVSTLDPALHDDLVILMP